MRPSFGARPTKDGVSFRLWAPAARRVDLLLDRRHAMQRRQDGWYVADIAGLRQGPWTDIYALSAVVYYLIAGKAPPPAVARMVMSHF